MDKNCKQCNSPFKVTDDDLEFYNKVSPVFDGKTYKVPPPTLCPICRQQRRMAWRNIRTLYKGTCDLCKQPTLSIYSEDKPYTVYCRDCYYSDKWNPLDYGRDFDFGPQAKPFFEQFDELLKAVPASALDVKEGNENCDYNNYIADNKNCYLIFAASFNEDSYYSMYLQRSRDIVDCYFVFDCELCYECIDCYNCYGLQHSQNCQNCSDSMFLYDCRGCKNCFGCVSLVNKEYHIFNKPYSKEEYERKVHELIASKDAFDDAQQKFEALRDEKPRKYYSGVSNESVTGDHISFSKNSYDCFDCTYLEDCKYCTWMHQTKTTYDCHGWGLPTELGYETHLSGQNAYNVRFSESCWDNVSDLLYCRYCMYACKYLFGCVGLQRKSYCILNKEYSQEEYEKLVPRIIEHMKKAGEWGEFFPMSISPYGYNETEGARFWPLSKEDAKRLGAKWKDEDQTKKSSTPPVEIPYKIDDVSDEIVGKTLVCDDCSKEYKLIAQELALYRRIGVPVPRKCHDCRYKSRVAMRSPRQLFERDCDKCGMKIQSTYSSGASERVYCEKCYLKEVY